MTDEKKVTLLEFWNDNADDIVEVFYATHIASSGVSIVADADTSMGEVLEEGIDPGAMWHLTGTVHDGRWEWDGWGRVTDSKGNSLSLLYVDTGIKPERIVICTNAEILGDGTYMYAADGADVVDERAIAIAADNVYPACEHDSWYANWRGGKYYQHWQILGGIVAVPKDARPETVALGLEVAEAMQREIADQDRLSQIDDCLHWADQLEEDRELHRWFGQHRLDQLLPGYDGDVDSLPEALRKRAAELS